jgi:hypothetical protein
VANSVFSERIYTVAVSCKTISPLILAIFMSILNNSSYQLNTPTMGILV